MANKMLRNDQRADNFPLQYHFSDDFLFYTSGAGNPWTSLATGTGAAVALTASAAGGIINLATGTGAAGNDSGVISSNAFWKFQKLTPMYLESLIQFTEISTNKANVFFGLSSVAAAGLMTDGAMSTASQSTVGIFKIDGQTNWNAFSSIGTTVTSTAADQTAGQSNWQRLGIKIRDLGDGVLKVSFFQLIVSDLSQTVCPLATPLTDTTQHLPIEHSITLGTGAAMKFVAIYAASGSGAAAESVNCDYAFITSHRTNTGDF